jgi:hypothetical protein
VSDMYIFICCRSYIYLAPKRGKLPLLIPHSAQNVYAAGNAARLTG